MRSIEIVCTVYKLIKINTTTNIASNGY